MGTPQCCSFLGAWLQSILTKLGQRNGCHLVAHQQWQLIFSVTKEVSPDEMQPSTVCNLLSPLTHDNDADTTLQHLLVTVRMHIDMAWSKEEGMSSCCPSAVTTDFQAEKGEFPGGPPAANIISLLSMMVGSNEKCHLVANCCC